MEDSDPLCPRFKVRLCCVDTLTRILYILLMNSKLWIVLLAFLQVVLPGLPDAQGAEPEHSHASVLILHSYHPGFTWTDNEMEGINKGLQAIYPEADLYIEYMDAKRFGDTGVHLRFIDLVRDKVQGTDYPVVIATDNIALELALDLRPELFPRAQIVFCGINGPPEEVIQGRARVTGVTETWDPAGTLKVIDQLQPGVKEIVVLHDYTESGLGTRKNLDAILPAFQDRFHFRFLPSQPVESIFGELASLPDTSAVLLMGYNIDSQGKVFDSADTGPLFARHSRVPVYTMDQTRFSGGVVGGSLLTGQRQGELAAAMAARILGGASADAIPIIREPVAVLAFDYTALKRFGLSPEALPENSRVINKPTSFYHQYRNQIWVLTALFVTLSMMIITLMLILLFRRRMYAERIKVVEALRESKELYTRLVDAIPDVIVRLDLTGKILFVNDHTLKISGYSRDELEGQNMLMFIDPEDHGKAIEYTLLMMDSRLGPQEYSLVMKDGRKIPFEVNGDVLRNADGTPFGIVHVCRDITERKKAEEEKKKLEDQLARVQKIEAIGTLAGGIAHDFNNLLTGILGNVSLVLMKMDEGDPFRERLKNIEDYVQRGSDLTKQLLGFARGGKYEVVPTDLGEFIKKSSKMFGRTKKEIHIHYKIQNGLWSAEVDRGQMEQVLLNLFVNAWQAMPGGGNLCLSAENVELDTIDVSPYNLMPGKYVKVTVTDTGVGMSESVKSRIFEPFFTTKERDRGTGLGLASVYGIIKNHEGFINVESQEGHGASFMFYLPASGKEPDGDENSTWDDVRMGSETILLIDDEVMILDIGSRMLEGLNYKVMTAVGGEQGLQIYNKHQDRIDLVILDMIMPDLSGKETFHALRRINPSVRVLLSSGYSLDDQAREIIQNGCKGFIQKPFTMVELSKKIRKSLED